MNQDEIIEMGAQAGIHREVLMLGRNLELLADFANLVAKHTLMNIDPSKFMSHQEVMEAARMAEREACAKVCQDLIAPDIYSDTDVSMWDVTCMDCAEAIRARGQA